MDREAQRLHSGWVARGHTRLNMVAPLLTTLVFALTMLLVFVRPWGLPEWYFTVAGGAAMLLLGLETPAQALQMVAEGREALLFLAGLLLLAELMQLSGFFEWVSILAARASGGNGRLLYRNVFLLGALVTAFLSLDTTAVMLTPVVMAFVVRLKLDAKPFLFACIFVANSGSLLLQVSNLTNLLFVGAFGWSFLSFASRMALAQLLVLAVNLILFQWLFRKRIPVRFDLEVLPDPHAVVPHEPFFRASVVAFLLVLLGYFAGSLVHLPPYLFAFAGAAGLLALGLWMGRIKIGVIRQISWSVFPFVIGLFVVVRAMENLGLAAWVGKAFLASSGSPVLTVLVGSFGAGLGSNVVNNIPMALVSISGLGHATDLARYSALLGCNVGPNLTVAGSLATMLVIGSARKRGEEVRSREFLLIGLVTTPLLLLAGAGGLLVSRFW